MDDKLKVLWNLDVLVKMCRSKSDGPSLRVEETEINNKIKNYQQEINDINSLSDEDSYDTSAEMADRNIEIITKKQLQTLKSELKEKNKELNSLKEEENKAYQSTNVLRETKSSYEKYILSMQERVESVNDNNTIDKYNNLIDETSSKIDEINDKLKTESKDYDSIQEKLVKLTEEISQIEEAIEKKKKLLTETQNNLQNKDNYVDHTKKDKNAKRVKELEEKIDSLNNRLEQIQKDPKYIETKIKDVINTDDEPENAKRYLIDLINIVIRQPYINIPVDNKLEEELLRATQARDSFANEVDQKTYNILEADTPEKTRISFLEKRINKWQEELNTIEEQVSLIDQDKVYAYKENEKAITSMIDEMKKDLIEFQKAYDETSDSNISLKASLKASLDEKHEDIVEAEKIATQFRLDEAKDIEKASYLVKNESEELKNNIINAQKEIAAMRNRLLSRKSGLIDIGSRNKDKDTLKELAQTVIDLKHRRQFPDTPIDVIHRLEDELKIDLTSSIDMSIINKSKELIPKDYDAYITKNNKNESEASEHKRGIKVVTEDDITTPEELAENNKKNTNQSEVTSIETVPIENIDEEESAEDDTEIISTEPIDELETIEDTTESAPAEEAVEQEPVKDIAETIPTEPNTEIQTTEAVAEPTSLEPIAEPVPEESSVEPVIQETNSATEVVEENSVNSEEPNTETENQPIIEEQPVTSPEDIANQQNITDNTLESKENDNASSTNPEEVTEPIITTSEPIINLQDNSLENIIDEPSDDIIEPILTLQIDEPSENSVKESVQPAETSQNDNTEAQNNDNIVISDVTE